MNYRPHEASEPSECDSTSGAASAHAEELAETLHRLWHKIARGMESADRSGGLQRQQFWVLHALEAGPQRMSALAERTVTSQASLTGIVDRLEDHGLVERVRPSDDRRVVMVALTDAGRAEMLDRSRRLGVRMECLLGPLPAEDRERLLELLHRLVDET